MHYVDKHTPVLRLAWLCMIEYSGKMHKSLKQSNSSENFPSPNLYSSQIPKILQTFTPSFFLFLLELFQAVEKSVLEHFYANFPQLESQELRSIWKTWWRASRPILILGTTAKLSCFRIGLTKHYARGVRGGGLTVCIHTDEDWSWGDLFRFNQDKAVCLSV